MAWATSGPVTKKLWSATSTGSPRGRHSRPRVSQLTQLLLLFRVDADDRLAGRLMIFDLLIEVAELGIPIRVLLPFEVLALACRLKPASRSSLPTVGAETACPWPVSSSARCRSDLVVHPRRRHRITPLVGLHQPQQGRQQLSVLLAGSLTSPACPADPTDRQRIHTAFEFHNALTHRALADPGHLRDRPHPTVTQQPGLERQRQPLLALVQMR